MAFGILGAACVASNAVAASPEAPFLALNAAAMDKMMADMAVKPSGDVDRDFVAMMIPHHQGAVEMATAELQYGRNQQLLRIAQEIVVEQLQEIAAMRLAIGEPATPTWATDGTAAYRKPASTPSAAGADAPFVSRLSKAMDTMMSDMAVRPSGDVDRDFVAMMIPHHQGAIEMAQAELQSGTGSQLKTIAQEIVTDQMQEIILMRVALGETLPTASPMPSPGNVLPVNPAHEADAASMRMGTSPGMRMAPPGAH